ncbi:hypothetical protein JCM15831A_23110 [Asaia astilbis]
MIARQALAHREAASVGNFMRVMAFEELCDRDGLRLRSPDDRRETFQKP